MTKYEVRPMVREDYFALVGRTHEADLWNRLAERVDAVLTQDSWTGLVDGQVVACGGLIHIWPGLAEAWIALTPNTIHHLPFVYRHIRQFLGHAILTKQLRRIDVRVRADFEAAQRLVAHLGFTFNAYLHKYGPNGEPFLLYTKVL